MTSGQKSFPVAPSLFKFAQHGQSGAWLSELLPHTAKVADDLCIVKSMHTEAINHDPAITFFQTGSQLAGRPSMGSWVAYGLGSENQDLPAFVVLMSRGGTDQPLYDRLWGSGFLPSRYQGVKFRGGKSRCFISPTPPAVDADTPPDARRPRRAQSSAARRHRRSGDPDAHRAVRNGLPHADVGAGTDRSVEGAGKRFSTCTAPTCRNRAVTPPTACSPGGWRSAACASSSSITWAGTITATCRHRSAVNASDTDQPSAALVQDLKQRGLLDDTLVIWGGEFGRTVYSQGQLTADNYGRDHHPRCFTIWLAGGGIKPGMTHGETDDFSYNIVRDPSTSTT